ncbi:MAG: cytochrome c [Bdellovibrionaceae bacterium]|nr:cytochrome c [Pseudobdellovibrionaceae bacterium]
MKNLLIPFFLIVLSANLALSQSPSYPTPILPKDYNPTISISIRRESDSKTPKKIKVTLQELLSQVKSQLYTVTKHPVYNEKSVTYDGFLFKDVIAFIAQKLQVDNVNQFQYSLWASDNFSAFISSEDLQSGEAFLAWREIRPVIDTSTSNISHDGLWTMVEKHGTPGPFYLVWNNPEKTYWQKWPFKIVDITLVSQNVLEKFNSVAPESGDFTRTKGFRLAIKNCTSCHHISGVGFGQMAGDLADIAKYRDHNSFVSQIRNPGGRMVPFTATELSDEDIHAIYTYLNSSGDRPERKK